MSTPPEQYQIDLHFMQLALQEAALAEKSGEVPIGAILVDINNQIIGSGFNQPISSHDPTAHAEIVAIRNAGHQIKNYRLNGTTLYVTLEPCAMCLGAMVHARIKRLVFGAPDPKKRQNVVNHSFDQTSGVLADKCGKMLQIFFQKRR